MNARVALSTFAVTVGVFLPLSALAYETGAPAGHTGAPQTGGRNCTRCHSGTANSGPASLAITTPSGTYTPGSLIPVTVSLGGSLQNPTVNGFQMAAFAPGNNAALPGWTPRSSTESNVRSNHLGHVKGGRNQTSWVAYFKTPAGAPNGFTLYAAGNDANGDGKNDNDRIYTTSSGLTPGAVPLSIDGTTVPSVGAITRLNLDSPGDAGKGYFLAASFGTAGIPIGGARKIPLSVDSLLLITVQNVLPALFRNYQGTLDASGRATAQLAAPNIAALRGIVLHHAFVVIDPPRPSGIATVSNPLPVTLF